MQSSYINIHTHALQTEENVLSIYNVLHGDQVPTGKFSIGIHPWYINEMDPFKQLAELRYPLSQPDCIALGECGLDKLKGSSHEVQLLMFKEQVKLADELNKPLIIHCVKRFQEVLQVIKEEKFEHYFLLHGYNSSPEIAKAFLTLPNAFFSFGKALLNQGSNASKLVSTLDTGRFFLETDDAEVSIKDIYKSAAAIKGIPEEELIRKITDNYTKVFEHGHD